MTHRQHKTRLVTGGLGKTNGATDIVNDAKIIDHFYLNSKAYLGLECGYNAGSKKPKQCPAPDNGGFVVPSFYPYAQNVRVDMQSLGVWVRSNPPAVLCSLEHPRLLLAVFNLKTQGGHHA